MNLQRRHRGGFSLLEILVAVLVLLATLAGVLGVFSTARRLALVQVGTADLQQSLRIAQREVLRVARMAGRGGLPLGSLPEGLAIAVRNNVPSTSPADRIAPEWEGSPGALPGSDVLILRGVFSTPLYQIAPATGALRILGEPASRGWVRIDNPSPSGIPQPLAPLLEAVKRGRPEALLLVSAQGSREYAIVELAPDLSATEALSSTSVTLGFRIRNGTHTARYLALCPDGEFPRQLREVWQVGLLEEHRYYVRSLPEQGDAAGTLARARLYPGTDSPHAGAGSNLAIPLADRVLDLQVALGLDLDGNGYVSVRQAVAAGDEWLFDRPGDDERSREHWRGSSDGRRLFYLRLTTVAQSSNRDVDFLATALPAIEDRPAEPSIPPDEAARRARGYRRWRLTSLAEPRNLW